MGTVSKVADELFALPKHYDSTGAKQHSILKSDIFKGTLLTSQDDISIATDRIISKINEMITHKKLLISTISQLGSSDLELQNELSYSPRSTALGQAREAEFYIDSSNNIIARAISIGNGTIIILGIFAILYSWYYHYRILPITFMFLLLLLASIYPVHTLQVPAMAVYPLKKLISL